MLAIRMILAKSTGMKKNLMISLKSLLVTAFAVGSMIGLNACDNRTPAEKVGDGLEEAAEGVEDAAD